MQEGRLAGVERQASGAVFMHGLDELVETGH